jgi:hypothetical protein
VESERLARLWFEAGRDPDFPRRLKELLHPEIAVALKTEDGEWLRGADAVAGFLDRRAGAPVYEATDEVYHPLDEDRVVVEGRLRWMEERDRTLRDDVAIWAMEFRDGLLYRSIAVRSVAEAEAVLAVNRSTAD